VSMDRPFLVATYAPTATAKGVPHRLVRADQASRLSERQHTTPRRFAEDQLKFIGVRSAEFELNRTVCPRGPGREPVPCESCSALTS
jgi:hypothetical protein